MDRADLGVHLVVPAVALDPAVQPQVVEEREGRADAELPRGLRRAPPDLAGVGAGRR